MEEHPLNGIWVYPSKSGENEFFWINESAGRVMCISSFDPDSPRIGSMFGWYRKESETTIAVKVWPRDDWEIHEIDSRNDSLVLRTPRGEFTVRRLPQNDFPEWLERKIAAVNARMDSLEQKG
jgi:hypothetical protein